MIDVFRSRVGVEYTAAWRDELILVLARTLAALFLIPAVATVAAQLLGGRLTDAIVVAVTYGLVVVAAMHTTLPAATRVAALLGALASLTVDILLSRGLGGLSVGVLGGTFALLVLLAWGRAPALVAIGGWFVVFALTAYATASGSIVPLAQQGARQVLVAVAFWITLTVVGVVAVSSVVARLEAGVRSAAEFERRLRAEAHERHVLAQRVLSDEEVLRGNLARELHDDIGQRLTAIKIALETATLRPQSTLAAVCAESARLAGELARDTSKSVNLAATPIARGGLAAAIAASAREAAASAGITAIVDVPQQLDLPDDAELHCYRIVQEALTNAIRHAGAGGIVVRAASVAGALELVVGDDGVGFDLEAAERLGAAGERLGLVGMRERAEAIGADLQIVSAPGRGTEIRITLADEVVA